MLDDLMDEYGVNEPPKKKTQKSVKNSKTTPKKVKPKTKKPKNTKKTTKSSKKERVVEEKELGTVHGDDSVIPPKVHDYLVNRYYNVYYTSMGTEQDFNTRQFRMWDNEDPTEDYTVRVNIEGGGRDVYVKEVFSNV